MNQQPHQRLLEVARVITRLAGIALFLGGIFGLCAWRFQWTGVTKSFPGLGNIDGNRGLGFALAGASLWLCRDKQGALPARILGRLLALGVVAIGAVALGNFLFGWFEGYAQWLWHGVDAGPLPGKMSYLAALNFVLSGLGLLLLDIEPKRGTSVGQFFSLVPMLVCLLAVIGYIAHLGIFYGETTLLPGTRLTRMTLVCFMVLTAGTLSARLEGGFMRVLVSRTDGGYILRRLVLLPVAVPLAATIIPLLLRRVNFTNGQVASWLFSFGDILLFTLIFWWSAAMLYRMDLKRQAAEDELKTLNGELERRVEERTGQLVTANHELKDEVRERRHAEEEVRTLNAELEQRVINRTAQINTAYKELEAFSYSVSHDLRAPLRAIGNYSAMLLEENPQLPEQSQTYLRSAQRNVEKMQRLIDDLLAFSRVSHQTLEKQTVELDELARQCFADLQPEAKGRDIKLTISERLQCRADPRLLKQLLVNLLSNAIKFTRQRETAQIEIGSLPPLDSLSGPVFFVKDNGAGFDMVSIGKLFGVFQRLHRESEFEGTGLGLAIVQNIVNRHGGRVWAESAPDKGATFYFTLPD